MKNNNRLTLKALKQELELIKANKVRAEEGGITNKKSHKQKGRKKDYHSTKIHLLLYKQ